MKVLVSTAPFGLADNTPIKLLDDAGIEFTVNPYDRKMSEEELGEVITDFDCLIAGTEKISKSVLANAQKLKLISRVGIGLDSVDLVAARNHNIQVTYTPDAPSPAVAELTIGLMVSLLRCIHISNDAMHDGGWQRFFGRRLSESTIGVIGAGRIGSRVIEHLSGFHCHRILVNDTDPGVECRLPGYITMASKESIFREADVITIHVPLTQDTRGMVGEHEFGIVKKNTVLINTARGGIVHEEALRIALENGTLFGAAIDTFETEPYSGPLCKLKQCLLTSHMGSMSEDCRARMEIEATQEVVRFVKGEVLSQEVPEAEYQNQVFWER